MKEREIEIGKIVFGFLSFIVLYKFFCNSDLYGENMVERDKEEEDLICVLRTERERKAHAERTVLSHVKLTRRDRYLRRRMFMNRCP